MTDPKDQPDATDDPLKRQTAVLLRMAKSQAIDSGDLSAALREITEAASQGLDIERVGVWFYEDASKDAMSSPDLYLRSDQEHATAPILSHTAFPVYFAELAKERVLPASDAHTHPGTAELSEAYLTPLGIGSLLDAPIRHHGRMVGIVCHEHVGPARQWTQEEINFAGSMADAVARALASEERRKAEIALRDANRDLESRIAERTQELARSNEELKRLHRAKDEMFHNVSHELRTPLTLILSPVEAMCERGDLGEVDLRRLTSVRRNALRLLSLINDLLDLAKLEATALTANAQIVDIGAALSRLADDIRQPAKDAGITLRYEGPGDGLFYSVDPDHLERVMLNLMSNALKFTPDGGQVTVEASDTDDGLAIAVRDTGVGIPAEALEHIFDRFRQAVGDSVRQFGGTGIGLSLAAQLVRLMDGTITVDSEPGKGAAFTVLVPTTHRSSGPAAPRPTTAKGLGTISRQAAYARFELDANVPRSRGDFGPLVVIAEDDPGVRGELVELLAPYYRVHACEDGEEAFEAVLNLRPHVALLDMMMPKMDGLSLTVALRERHELRDTAIIMLTARDDLADRVRGREVGVDAYLTKPYHGQEVLATIRGLLRSRMRVVGNYLLHERVGSGGQASVYRAEHLETGTPAALKLIGGLDTNDSRARERLARERQALTTIEHPNIVRVLEEGEHEGRFYVAMEYLSGVNLVSLVRRSGALNPDETAAIAIAMCDALSAVHGAGLLHRDVKSANIMVLHGKKSLRQRTRLIDFGAVFRQDSQTDTSLIGTLSYTAPEILAGEAATVASDLYGLGITMFYMATAALPFEASDRERLVRDVMQGAPTNMDVFVKTAPQPLVEIVSRAIARAPAQRFQSARSLRDALAAAFAGDAAGPSAAAEDIHDMPTQVKADCQT